MEIVEYIVGLAVVSNVDNSSIGVVFLVGVGHGGTWSRRKFLDYWWLVRLRRGCSRFCKRLCRVSGRGGFGHDGLRAKTGKQGGIAVVEK